MKPDEKILHYLRVHFQMTISVIHNNESWSANCFYVFDDEEISLIFVSDSKTKHASGFIENPIVSGTISDVTESIVDIKGIQFKGVVESLENEELIISRKRFTQKFPLAKIKQIEFWKLKLDYLKMTDNKFLFASKTCWQRAD